MSLPRTNSVFDAAPLRRAFATVASPTTGMQVGDAPTASFDVAECSDATFDDWLEKQFPNLDARDQAFEHKRFTNEMMQEWMTLTTAATEALMALVSATVGDIAANNSPQDGMGNYYEEDFPTAQDRANQSKAWRLLGRARRVQAKISFAV